MSGSKKIHILGIETSCDETAAALVEVKAGRFKILSNTVFSQIKIHRQYGGVVPEVAARNHVLKILPVIKQVWSSTCKGASTTRPYGRYSSDRYPSDIIDAIAVTAGPGLITSLLVGVETAKVLAYVWQKSLIAINHIEAHILANWLMPIRKLKCQNSNVKTIEFPVVCLVVSGGHTELILIKKIGNYKKIGRTRDDAAGECFDKVAKLLNIGYPGGPIISKLAAQGNPQAFDFPRPMIDSNNLDFSFSGLKTAALYLTRKLKNNLTMKQFNNETIANLCASVQQAIVDVLVSKTIKAAENYKVKTIMLAGGVAANPLLRQELEKESGRLGVNYLVPPFSLCTDNAAMIAIAGYYHFLKKDFIPWQKIKVNPNLEIGQARYK